MNYGKLNEDIYERSVVKVMNANMHAYLHTNSLGYKDVYNGAGRGDFCAVFPCEIRRIPMYPQTDSYLHRHRRAGKMPCCVLLRRQ